MMRILKNFASTFLIFVTVLSNAQGFQVNLQGQIQQGMGGAGTACIQDGAAVFFNPGGMSFLKGNSANIGVSPVITNGVFLDKSTNLKYETNSPVSYPFAAYGVFEVNDSSKLKMGLGIYTPFGSTVSWNDDWAGHFVLTRLQLQAIFFQPTLSYKINKMLGIGVGFVYASGKVNLQKDLPLTNANGNYGHAELKGAANGYGFNAGIYFQPIEKISIGLTYRSQVKMKVSEGDATFDVPASLSANFPNGKFTSTLPLPQVLTLGLGYRATEKLLFALDVNYVGWKIYDTLAFDYKNNTSSLLDTKSARNYKNTFAFRFGTQYKLNEKLILRLGFAYGMSPIQNGYVTPETPDADRINYTAGVGYQFTKNFGLIASFLFTQLKRTDTNLETNLSGTYKTNVFAPGLALTYNF
jgi:long-chain fatty acid transport protein